MIKCFSAYLIRIPIRCIFCFASIFTLLILPHSGLCFRFVGKDRASSFLPQIKKPDFLNGFLNGNLRAKKSMGYVWILVFL